MSTEAATTEANPQPAPAAPAEQDELVTLLGQVKSGELSLNDAAVKIKNTANLSRLVQMLEGARVKAATPGRTPWVKVPPDLVVPRGRNVINVRLPAIWTDRSDLGEPMNDLEAIKIAGVGTLWRQCIMWPLTEAEEQMALERCKQDGNQVPREFTKQMIRAIDGVVVNWSGDYGAPGSVDGFWNDIGTRGRNMLVRIYTQVSQLGPKELVDFFESCVDARTAG